MLQSDLNNLSIAELMDVLAKDTINLLELMNQRETSGNAIHEKRKELQMIQAAIEERKSNKLRIV